MVVKKIIKKIIYSYKNSSDDYIKYLSKKGVILGKNIYIFCPKDTHIDINNPHLLKIGNIRLVY